MPIKWTAEVDQVVSLELFISSLYLHLFFIYHPNVANRRSYIQLLLKILETSQINADVKAISEAWRKSRTHPIQPLRNEKADTISPQPRGWKSQLPAPSPNASSKSAEMPKMPVPAPTSAFRIRRPAPRMVHRVSVHQTVPQRRTAMVSPKLADRPRSAKGVEI